MKINSYKDRQGNIIEKKVLSEDSIHFLYTTFLGRCALKVMASKTMANTMRFFLETPFSTLFIDSFIKKNGIGLKDYIPCKYSNFNKFFTREVWPEKRPIAEGKDVIITPSDGRVSVFKINDKSVFTIKNSEYSVKTLLRSKKLADYYKDGYFVLIRLAVDNYHRYVYSVSGRKSPDREIDGFLHTVNPVVLDYVNVYCENARTYTVIDTGKHGKVTQMEVGAMGVGRIVNFCRCDCNAHKGQKKGMFEFGGSSIILLFPKDKAEIDLDLIMNSMDGYETSVKMGEKIGVLK